jgi:hypothetical protein
LTPAGKLQRYLGLANPTKVNDRESLVAFLYQYIIYFEKLEDRIHGPHVGVCKHIPGIKLVECSKPARLSRDLVLL